MVLRFLEGFMRFQRFTNRGAKVQVEVFVQGFSKWFDFEFPMLMSPSRVLCGLSLHGLTGRGDTQRLVCRGSMRFYEVL